MNPDIEDELDNIGWKPVKYLFGWQAQYISSSITSTGGKFAQDRVQAREMADRLTALIKNAEELCHGLLHLTDEQEVTLNVNLTEFEDRDRGIPDHVSDMIESIANLRVELDDLHSMIMREAGEVKPGRPKNEAARSVCAAIAEIYVLRYGKIPRIGRLEDGSGVSGRYGQTCHRVLTLLGLEIGDVYRVCADAISRVDGTRAQSLVAMRHRRRGFLRALDATMAKDT